LYARESFFYDVQSELNHKGKVKITASKREWKGSMEKTNFVSKLDHIQKNIVRLDGLSSGPIRMKQYHRDRIRKGHCFVWTSTSGRRIFAPSRFAGYKNNTMNDHELNPDKHGGETNAKISRLLGSNPTKDPRLEAEFMNYCRAHGIVPEKRIRKYWKRGV